MARVFNLKLDAPLAAHPDQAAFFQALRAQGGVLAGAGKVIPWVSVFSEHPRRLAGLPGVRLVEEDSGCDQCADLPASGTSMDPWHLRMVEADAAAGAGAGSRIAVIDTGWPRGHPELRGARIATRESFVPMEGPEDRNGHGTSTHALIAGQGPVVVGVARAAEIHSLKALDARGRGRWAWIALAVERAAELNCGVATMALGGPDRSHMLEDALALYASRGGIAACAAGNDGTSAMDYPGSSAYVLSVAAVDRHGRVPQWSSWAPWPAGPDCAAPGVEVPTVGLRGYKHSSGTSIATALAGGLLAIGHPRSRREVHAACAALPASRDRVGAGLLDAALLARARG